MNNADCESDLGSNSNQRNNTNVSSNRSLQSQLNEVKDAMRDLSAKVEPISVLRNNIKHLEESIAKLVTQMEFAPVKLIAYGLAGGVLMTVMGAILSLVVLRK